MGKGAGNGFVSYASLGNSRVLSGDDLSTMPAAKALGASLARPEGHGRPP